MILKENNLEVYLSDKLIDSSFYTESPFIIFEKSPFIDVPSYKRLLKEIYSLNDFNYTLKGKGEKKKRSVNLSNVNELADGTFKDFCLAILSADFYNWFKNTHLPHFNKKIFNVRVTNPNHILIRLLRKFSNLINLPFGAYYTEVEYSSLCKNSFIPPHTDARNKRLSFVFYLPSEKKISKEQKSALGTVFWKPKNSSSAPLRRFDCNLLDGKESKKFYKDYEVAKVAKYEPNKVACFIKSDNSWHTVEKIKFDYDRRAIVINVWQV